MQGQSVITELELCFYIPDMGFSLQVLYGHLFAAQEDIGVSTNMDI